MTITLWLRAETRADERRTPLTPSDAARLVEDGFSIMVEESAERVFADAAYAAAGCRLVPPGSWTVAPDDAFILGIKELPTEPAALRHRHVYFAHAYKEQSGWRQLLGRFVAGGGQLFDLEYLTDTSGARVAAFGYWAGFAGAALGVRLWAGRQREGSEFKMSAQRPAADQNELVSAIRTRLELIPEDRARQPKSIIIGALGRSGRGASALFDALGMEATGWDVAETTGGGPFPELLDYDLLVNTVLLGAPIPPFLTRAEIAREHRRLGVIADVSCDPSSAANPLPIYERVTSFAEPAVRVIEGDNPLDIVAVDNLPSLLPRESSIDFSSQLLPHLAALREGSDVWRRAIDAFTEHCARL